MSDPGLQKVFERLTTTLARDILVQQTTNNLRKVLQADRVILYYFYREWEGRVTFESLSRKEFSILGSTGPDECFNGEYAALYEAGRIRAIANIETEPIEKCHRDFLRELGVRANLVVPVLSNTKKILWGLLIAHHCQDTYNWSQSDVETMQKAAQTLATSSVIKDS
jgi:GAF domain-containing protein